MTVHLDKGAEAQIGGLESIVLSYWLTASECNPRREWIKQAENSVQCFVTMGECLKVPHLRTRSVLICCLLESWKQNARYSNVAFRLGSVANVRLGICSTIAENPCNRTPIGEFLNPFSQRVIEGHERELESTARCFVPSTEYRYQSTSCLQNQGPRICFCHFIQ